MRLSVTEPGASVVHRAAKVGRAVQVPGSGRDTATGIRADSVSRYLVYGVLLYTCVEGLIINIFYPSLLPHLYKDLGIAALYLFVFLPRPQRLNPVPLRPIVLSMMVFGGIVLSYLAVSEMGMWVAVVGLKQKLFYLPLAGVGYFFARSGRDLRRLLLVLVVSSIGVSAFGIYLHFSGPELLRRIGANYSAVIQTASAGSDMVTYWRVPGTFTSPGQFGSYLIFNGVIAASVLLTGSFPKIWRMAGGVAVAFCTIAMFGTGSRAPFLLLSVCVGGLILLTRSIPRLAVGVVTVMAAVAIGLAYLGVGVKMRFASIIDYEHVSRFERTYFGQLFLPALAENPLGSGLGVSTVGARHFADLGRLQLVESYFGILAIEMGLAGLTAGALLLAVTVLSIFRYWQSWGDTKVPIVWYGLAAYVLVTIAVLPISTALDHTPANVYFWFAVGVLARFPELVRPGDRTRRAASRRVHTGIDTTSGAV